MRLFKLIVVTSFLFCLSLQSVAQKTQKIDSPPTRKQLDTLALNMAAVLKGDSVNKAFRDSVRRADSVAKASAAQKSKSDSTACGCKPDMNGRVDDAGKWLLTFLPAIIFIGLLVWIFNSKGLKEFSLRKALSENTYPTIRVDNPQYTAANLTNATLTAKENLDDVLPPTIEKTFLRSNTAVIPGTNPPVTITTQTPPPPNPSISRYIAFITSILALVVALGISCFYLYHYIRTACPPELTGISTLLIALGIGVMPYVFNKLAGAIGKSKDE